MAHDIDMQKNPLVEVDHISVSYDGVRTVLDDISFAVYPGETLGLVGESGCGKSTLGRAILRLTPTFKGSIRFMGKDMTLASGKGLRELRRDVQMVFQDPYASLNPRLTVAEIIGDPLRNYGGMSKDKIRARINDLLVLVGLSPQVGSRYAHELSGGQRQRVGIARALALNPALIVCDEPISALDVSIQAQIVNLLDRLQNELNLTYVFIAHDLAVVRHLSDRIAVMYLGKIVELGSAMELCAKPLHPYSKALLDAVPIPEPAAEQHRLDSRRGLQGDISMSATPENGCIFAGRCPMKAVVKTEQGIDCMSVQPRFEEVEPQRFAACHLNNRLNPLTALN